MADTAAEPYRMAVDVAGNGNSPFPGSLHDAETLISLTIEEHRELGREMKATAQRLRALCELVITVYGPANRAAFSFLKALEATDRLEQDLATQAMQDLPGYPSNDIYL
jgi:hypothetical protein